MSQGAFLSLRSGGLGEVLALGCCLLYDFPSLCRPILSFYLCNSCSLFHSAAAGGKKEKSGKEMVQSALLGCLLFSQASSPVVDCKIQLNKNFPIVN